MQTIRSALIIGAGAIGAVVATRLYDSDPDSVSLYASGERRERYLRDGIIVNGRRYDFHLATEADGPFDLILIAVKTYSLDEAINAARPFVGPRTTIISLLNGITSEEALRAEFGAEKVPLAFIISIDATREGNRTSYHNVGEIRAGFEKGAREDMQARVREAALFLSSHGMPCAIPEDMLRELWYKFMINVSINPWSALLRGSYGFFRNNPSARRLLAETMREVIELSRACGTGLQESDIERAFAAFDRLNPEGLTSMLQDILACRRTEVEAFAGVMVDKCAREGIPAPLNHAILLAIRALEEQQSADLSRQEGRTHAV